ncbi:hypothetical protein CJ202_09875 [Corynebacterium parakroppenstedtii]|uniref:hypothetical protein n=1 Tax=Corynebacterium parakroppenstedtii TaxID=2828363 RepID=UPI00061970A1|nr:hypothetical protein [Corynebacterium parakroppenstedtii]KXB49935.1 condensation domain protein [Corynebacterium kroppenstedtii]PMC65696.1 hypothetical protein CJ202_09875 [Corynebacterium kroppenstedtii]
MDVCYLDDIALSGPCTQYILDWDGIPGSETFPLTLNQRNHLESVRASGRPSWVAGSFILPISVLAGIEKNVDTIADAIRTLIGDYDALRLVPSDPSESEGSQRMWSNDQLSISTEAFLTDSRADSSIIRQEVEARIDAACVPGHKPGLFFARCGRRLVVATDHFHADMASIHIILRRLGDLVASSAEKLGNANNNPAEEDAGTADGNEENSPAPDPAGAPSFIDVVRKEKEASARWHDSSNNDELQRALAVWKRFFDHTEGIVPAFPAELGATESVTPHHRTELLVPAADMTGPIATGTFAEVMATLASSVHTVVGAESLPCVVPIHTRGRSSSPYHGTVGWMVSNGPVIAEPGNSDVVRQWLRDGINAVTVPLDIIMETFRPVMPTPQPFMVSYSDFRTGPGRSAAIPGAVYFSSLAPTATVQLWFTRNDKGLSLRAKYPGTPQAEAILDECVDDLTRRLTGTASTQAD